MLHLFHGLGESGSVFLGGFPQSRVVLLTPAVPGLVTIRARVEKDTVVDAAELDGQRPVITQTAGHDALRDDITE
jgi:hypothetical protein